MCAHIHNATTDPCGLTPQPQQSYFEAILEYMIIKYGTQASDQESVERTGPACIYVTLAALGCRWGPLTAQAGP
jgi:hypothetical protein